MGEIGRAVLRQLLHLATEAYQAKTGSTRGTAMHKVAGPFQQRLSSTLLRLRHRVTQACLPGVFCGHGGQPGRGTEHSVLDGHAGVLHPLRGQYRGDDLPEALHQGVRLGAGDYDPARPPHRQLVLREDRLRGDQIGVDHQAHPLEADHDDPNLPTPAENFPLRLDDSDHAHAFDVEPCIPQAFSLLQCDIVPCAEHAASSRLAGFG